MRICIAQTRPLKGDILGNIEAHLRLIGVAARDNASHIFFPELSITGYEPKLASKLAMRTDDVRLEVFQNLSDLHSMMIGVGVPTIAADGILITMLIFQPGEERQAYSKQYLHADEEPYFVSGNEPVMLERNRVALAICYELSVPRHPENAYLAGADIYLVSVAKTMAGMEKSRLTLGDIARRYAMTVLVSNCVGHCDDFNCGGGSAIWNKNGGLLARLDETQEGLLIFDTETEDVTERQPLYEGR